MESKKIYFDVISNIKMFYIKFYFKKSCQRPILCQTHRGLDKVEKDWIASKSVLIIP